MEDINIEAFKIDKTYIYYKCPFCRSSYKKNGEPTKNSRAIIHRHGSDGNYQNRIEHRCHHTIYNHPKNAINCNGVFIHITENTKRINNM
mgnify:FL=1